MVRNLITKVMKYVKYNNIVFRIFYYVTLIAYVARCYRYLKLKIQLWKIVLTHWMQRTIENSLLVRRDVSTTNICIKNIRTILYIIFLDLFCGSSMTNLKSVKIHIFLLMLRAWVKMRSAVNVLISKCTGKHI